MNTKTDTRAARIKRRNRAVGATGIAVVAMSGLAFTAPAAQAQQAPEQCGANFVVSQDITFSWSQAEFDSAKQQVQNATRLFEGTGVPATMSLAAWGRIAPLKTAPPLLGVDIESAAGNQQMLDASAAYGFDKVDSGGTNWQTGLAWAESYAAAQGAKDIVFITDGVPNSYTDSSGVFHTNLNGATVDYAAAAAAAGEVADSIRAKGYNLHIVFARTSATGGGGLGDTMFPADPARVTQSMQELQPGWSIDDVVSVDQIGQEIMDATLAACTPDIELTKSHAATDVEDTNGNGRTDAGDKVVFTFLTTNVGNMALTNAIVTDPKLAAAGVTLAGGGSLGNLAVGESKTITSAPYTLTAEDETAGTFLNTATVNANSPKGDVTDEDDDSVPLQPGTPGIELVKSHAAQDVTDVNGNGITDAGDTVLFSFVATNTGEIPLTNTRLTDPNLAAAGVALQNGGVIGDLAVGASATLKSEAYTITAADEDRGYFLNVATVDADSPRGPVNDDDDDRIPAQPGTPGIDIVKSHAETDVVDVNGDGVTNVGDTVVFTLTGKNIGNLPLTEVVITDQILADAGVALENGGTVGNLAIGASATVKSNPYTITQADVDRGEFVNVATIKGTSPRGPVTDEDDDKVPTDGTPAISLEKSHVDEEIVDVNENGLLDVGDLVTYVFDSTNTGSLTITDAVVADADLAAAGVKLVDGGVVGTLVPGETKQVKSEPYPVTQADLDRGEFVNTATVTGQTPKGPVTDEDDDKIIPDQKPGIELEKTHEESAIVDVNENGMTDLGDQVVFTLTATNTGNVTITNPVITDEKLTAAGVLLENEGVLPTLLPGESATILSEAYTFTQEDVDATEFVNVALVKGDTPKGPVEDDDDDKVPTKGTPGIEIVKSHEDSAFVDANGNGTLGDKGDQVSFTFEVTNTGTYTSKDTVVTDEKLDAAGVALQDGGALGDLAPDEVVTITSEAYTITQEDQDRGEFVNVAVVTGDTPDGPVTDDDDDKVPTKTPPAPPVAPAGPQSPLALTGSEAGDAGLLAGVLAALGLGSLATAIIIRRNKKLAKA